MIHFDDNVLVVMENLRRYNYKPKVIWREKNHLDRIRKFLVEAGVDSFDYALAVDCLEKEITSTEKRPCRLSLNRLNDVYVHGRILASHLRIFGTLTEDFKVCLDSFMSSIESYTAITREFYRRVCVHFCCFCQLNGIHSPAQINYGILKEYHIFVKEGGDYRHYETEISNFIKYLADNGECRLGYSVALRLGKFERVFTTVDLSSEKAKKLESLKLKTSNASSLDFYSSLPDFRNTLLKLGYTMQSSSTIMRYLDWLFVFLDSADAGYSREIANLWATSAAGTIYADKCLWEVFRSFDLYDDYLCYKEIFPSKRNRRSKSNYKSLPIWCKTIVDRFISDREREGKAPTTIRQNVAHISKFCLFLENEGLSSFTELTPAIIKKSLLQNENLAVGTKWAYNYGVREFLIRMEIRNEIRSGMHLAIPKLCADHEKIVTVLSNKDRNVLELYCKNANTPIELRDAAIIKLGLNTALRAIDVVSLRFSDFDWKNRIIKIIQSKTKVEHIHPVDVDTLNSVYKYLKNGRSNKGSNDYVFISTKAPYNPVSNNACNQALKRAGASAYDFHRLRRTYATDILKAGATISETAELLGQSDTNSVHSYTLLDESRMRLCPLSLNEMGLSVEGRYNTNV